MFFPSSSSNYRPPQPPPEPTQQQRQAALQQQQQQQHTLQLPQRQTDLDEEEEDDWDEEEENEEKQPDNTEALKILLSSMDEEQSQRYEAYRRTKFSKAPIKKLVSNVLGQQIPPQATMIMAGVGKIFVGEIVELAKEVQEEWGHEGAISPAHLREAYRRYQRDKHVTLIPNN
ncbi:transcription initiation factor TFIID subunit 11, partial [Lobulomyces angularis]